MRQRPNTARPIDIAPPHNARLPIVRPHSPIIYVQTCTYRHISIHMTHRKAHIQIHWAMHAWTSERILTFRQISSNNNNNNYMSVRPSSGYAKRNRVADKNDAARCGEMKHDARQRQQQQQYQWSPLPQKAHRGTTDYHYYSYHRRLRAASRCPYSLPLTMHFTEWIAC